MHSASINTEQTCIKADKSFDELTSGWVCHTACPATMRLDAGCHRRCAVRAKNPVVIQSFAYSLDM